MGCLNELDKVFSLSLLQDDAVGARRSYGGHRKAPELQETDFTVNLDCGGEIHVIIVIGL